MNCGLNCSTIFNKVTSSSIDACAISIYCLLYRGVCTVLPSILHSGSTLCFFQEEQLREGFSMLTKAGLAYTLRVPVTVSNVASLENAAKY